MHKQTVVCHLTSAHPREDVRIREKQAVSLAGAGYCVHMVVADGKGEATYKGVVIHDVGRPSSRFERMRLITKKVLLKAIEVNADIYHLHDPELLPVALRLKKRGKKVVFDAHEDVPKQILSKPYLHKSVRGLVSKIFQYYENWAVTKLDGIVAATPYIRDKFLKVNKCCIDINNYPLLHERDISMGEWERKNVCYVGGISTVRGCVDIVRAMSFVEPDDVNLLLAGKFTEGGLENKLQQEPSWRRVQYEGWLNREGVQDVYRQSFAGLVTLHPILNYLDSLPVKMFEYMSAGVPVICSDFPLWKEIVETNQCGICVNPLDSQEIAGAINYLRANPDIVKEMGVNGQKAVNEIYNWQIEEKKLLSFYNKVLSL